MSYNPGGSFGSSYPGSNPGSNPGFNPPGYGSSSSTSYPATGMPPQNQYGPQPQGMIPPGYLPSAEIGTFNGSNIPLLQKKGFFSSDYAAVLPGVYQKVNLRNGLITPKYGGTKSTKKNGGRRKSRRKCKKSRKHKRHY